MTGRRHRPVHLFLPNSQDDRCGQESDAPISGQGGSGVEVGAPFGHPVPMQQGDKSASQPHPKKSLAGRSAIVFAAVFLLAGVYFGSTHDFGAFLLSIPILPLTFFGALILTILATWKRDQRRLAGIAWVLIGLAAPAYFISYDLTQRVRFFIWAPAHFHELDQASRKNGVIMDWDGWGMAGMDTESYLVVDTEDQLVSKARADQWTTQIGQTCGLWKVQRMWPRFYVVTTYTDCPYDGVPLIY